MERQQGTIVYFELHSNKDIDPNDVVENRTNCVEQFDDEFINTDEFDNLWKRRQIKWKQYLNLAI